MKRTRKIEWYDMKADRILYGFQEKSEGRWCHVHADGKPCIYTTDSERDEAMKRVTVTVDEKEKE